MEDKKEAPDNQTTDSSGKDLHFTGDGFENLSDKFVKQYGRDFMLQLRLHPLSLQKPTNLPELEFIKEKLYLNHIGGFSCASEEKHGEMNYFHTPVKSDYCGMKDYPVLPHYFGRMYPYCFSPHMYNGNYQNSAKFRSPFHTYCTALKKNSLGNHSCYRDYPVDECLWAKRCYTSSDDIWCCYPGHSHSTPLKKEEFEAVPKTKKKLPIIDPVTGKNVLDGVTKTSSEQENNSSMNENTESSENFNAELPGDNYFCNADGNNETAHTSDDAYDGPSEEKLYYGLSTDDNMYQPNFLNDSTPDISDNIASGDKVATENLKEREFSDNKDETGAVGTDANADKILKNVQKIHDNYEAQKLFNKQTSKAVQSNRANNPADVHGHCQNQYRNAHICKENALKQNEAVNESVKQLREKVYFLRQEQQKMTIMKSFLRYKKFQLEENAKSLDEKKIEMANWEYSLFNKAKLLQEKEHWLENRCEVLNNKAQQLSEKEKHLNREKNKVSGEAPTSKNNPTLVPKDSQFSERKSAYDNHNEILWEKICSKIKSYRNDETGDGEYSYFGYPSNQNKSAHVSPTSNVEKCKSDGCSLDELEKNIVMMEKLHSETSEDGLENKTEPIPSVSIQKKDENVCCEPIGYSKGRRYLPEHLKYWLNNRDKKGMN